MESHKNYPAIIHYLDQALVVLFSVFLVALPLLFTPLTTDAFSIPKQALLTVVVLLGLILWGIKMFFEGGIFIRRAPFDLPLFIFLVVVGISGILSVNRADALTNIAPLLLSIVLYFLIVNTARSGSSFFFYLAAFILGGVVLSLLFMLSYRKIYLLPSPLAHSQLFSPVGSLYDQAIFLGVATIVALQSAWSSVFGLLKRKSSYTEIKELLLGLGGFVTLAGFVLTLYELLYVQKPILLPFIIGFQTAFAAISQDTSHLIQSFLFGNGYGTYINVFTRFKPVSINQDPTLWSYTFFRSSSYILELIATTGFLGIISFVYLIMKIVRELKHAFSQKKDRASIPNPLVFALAVSTIALFVIPFSFLSVIFFFVILGLFAAGQELLEEKGYFDMHLYIVAFEHGIIAFSHKNNDKSIEGKRSKVLPFLLLIILAAFSAILGYYATTYVLSDLLFQKSLVAASKNQGSLTYDLENKAIQMFKYRDGYYRIFSQTNLALANILAAQESAKKQETQKTIYLLIQQAINAGRNATTLAPGSAMDWQNLSSIYRSLIGFGQNAEQFAVLASQQAIILDPNNPQEYINLGGIYYQLGQWDEAQRQFQAAVSLKPDYPNAFYNLGHALEQKGNLQDALTQYNQVKTLLVNDPTNLEKINAEIAALEAKIKTNSTRASQPVKAGNDTLGISTPPAKLPEQKPPVKIPAPGVSTPTPTPTK